MMPSLTDEHISRLLHGFTDTFKPEDVVSVREASTTVEPDESIIQATAQDVYDLYGTLVVQAQENVDTLTTLCQQVSAQTTLSPDEYFALLNGSPSLDQIDQLRAFEQYHLSEDGTPEVFLYEDAVLFANELRDIYDHTEYRQALARKPGITDYDFLSPIAATLEFFEVRALAARDAISSIDAALPPQQAFGKITVGDVFSLVLGDDSGILSAIKHDMTRAQIGATLNLLQGTPSRTVDDIRSTLRKTIDRLEPLRAVLMWSYYLTLKQLHGDIQHVRRSWNTFFAQRVAETKITTLQSVYNKLLEPVSEIVLHNAPYGPDVPPLIAVIQQEATTIALEKLMELKHELTNYAVFHTERYSRSQQKSERITKSKRLNEMAKCLRAIIQTLERYAQESDPLRALTKDADIIIYPLAQFGQRRT